jgi:hypothetical protein
MHLMLLRICEFHQNRLTECCTFLMGVNEISYIRACNIKPHGILKVNNALVKFVDCVTECTICDIGMNGGISKLP